MSLLSLSKEVDYDPLTGEFRWLSSNRGRKRGNAAGGLNGSGYRCISFKGKLYRAHRLAFVCMGEQVPLLVDHINGVRDDNRWSNIRPATYAQNRVNSVKLNKNKSSPKGVYFCPGRKKPWRVCLTEDNTFRHYGYYNTEEEATSIAVAEYERTHGEYSPYRRKSDEEI